MRCSAIIIAAVSLVLTCGCNGAPEEEALETKTIGFSEITPLQQDAPFNFTMEMDIEWPVAGTGGNALKEMQKGITGLLFGSELETTDIEYAVKAYNRKTIEFYQEVNLEYLEDIEEDWGFMLNWSETVTGKFLPQYKGMASYVKYLYGYSGGAHGMDSKECLTFSLRTGAEVMEKDLFKEGYEDRLTAELREHLLLTVKDHGMLFETQIRPNENFYLTPTGITYIYQRYEVGPYVLGIVEVTVPWSDIRDIIR